MKSGQIALTRPPRPRYQLLHRVHTLWSRRRSTWRTNAACAAAAHLKTSLTARGVARSVAFVTPRVGANEVGTDWQDALQAADTGMIYMGAGEAQSIATTLLAQGKPGNTPVALVESASLAGAQQHITTLARLSTGWFPATDGGPVMMGVGAVFGKVGARLAGLPLALAA